MDKKQFLEALIEFKAKLSESMVTLEVPAQDSLELGEVEDSMWEEGEAEKFYELLDVIQSSIKSLKIELK